MSDEIINLLTQFFRANGLSDEEFDKEATMVQKLGRQLGFEPEINQMIRQKRKEINAGYVTGSGQEMLPLRNAEEIKAAAGWLTKYRTRLAYSMRRKIAENILEKAATLCVTLDPEVERQLKVISGNEVGDLNIIRDQLDKRIQLLSGLGFTKKAQTLANLRKDIDEDVTPTVLQILALAIDRMDRDYAFINKYGTVLLPPEDFLFKKEAEKLPPVKVVVNRKTGAVYNRDDIMMLKLTLLESLGEDFVKQAAIGEIIDPEKVIIWLEDASQEKAELFDKIAKISGVYPIGYCQPE